MNYSLAQNRKNKNERTERNKNTPKSHDCGEKRKYHHPWELRIYWNTSEIKHPHRKNKQNSKDNIQNSSARTCQGKQM
jgi:hypothetical protein